MQLLMDSLAGNPDQRWNRSGKTVPDRTGPVDRIDRPEKNRKFTG
jgi:hypothetical protein